MKAGADKSSSTTQSAVHKSPASPFFAKQGDGTFFSPVRPSVQAKMTVGKPGDKFEQEADRMAGKVMRMSAPAATQASGKEEKLRRQPDDKLRKKEDEKLRKAPAQEEKLQKKEDDKLQKAPEPEQKLQKKEEEKLQKAPVPEEKLQKKEDEKFQRKEAGAAGSVASNVQSGITGNMAGGQALSNDVRSFMEPRFNADFSSVRVHSDRESASLNNQLSARAFTYQNHIFFSRDQYQPGTSDGKQLLAHELTHTIQQGHAVQRAPQVRAVAEFSTGLPTRRNTSRVSGCSRSSLA
jgi:flagellar biosynthesis GTPase FlhF